MTITYPLILPQSTDLSTASFTFGMDFAVSQNASPSSYKPQVYKRPGERWLLQATYPIMNTDNARILQTFLLSLKGTGTFTFKDPAFAMPKGSWVGTPVVNGVQAAGSYNLNLKGFTPSAAKVVKAGDRFQIGDGYYMALKDADADGSGGQSIDIIPKIRVQLTDNEPVVFENPLCLMRLQDSQIKWPVAVDRTTTISFNAIEAL